MQDLLRPWEGHKSRYRVILDPDKSWNEGCVKDSLYRPGAWYWKQYAQSGLFDLDKPVRDYTKRNITCFFTAPVTAAGGAGGSEGKPGLYNFYKKLLNRDISNKSRHTREKSQSLVTGNGVYRLPWKTAEWRPPCVAESTVIPLRICAGWS